MQIQLTLTYLNVVVFDILCSMSVIIGIGSKDRHPDQRKGVYVYIILCYSYFFIYSFIYLIIFLRFSCDCQHLTGDHSWKDSPGTISFVKKKCNICHRNVDILYTNVLPTVFQSFTSQKGRSGQPQRPEKRFVKGLTTS